MCVCVRVKCLLCNLRYTDWCDLMKPGTVIKFSIRCVHGRNGRRENAREKGVITILAGNGSLHRSLILSDLYQFEWQQKCLWSYSPIVLTCPHSAECAMDAFDSTERGIALCTWDNQTSLLLCDMVHSYYNAEVTLTCLYFVIYLLTRSQQVR
jgi:hypothetical protein